MATQSPENKQENNVKHLKAATKIPVFPWVKHLQVTPTHIIFNRQKW